MNIEVFREYCMAKKGVTEEFPFDEDTLVFKVMGKMFALSSLKRLPAQANLKCDPDRALELREEYDGTIIPGYHMSKKHWNTIELKSATWDELKNWIDISYGLVFANLTKKAKLDLQKDH